MNPSLSLLVGTFLQKTGGVAPADALYVIELGVNDLRDAIEVAFDLQNPLPILTEAASAIAANISVVHAAGARQFLLWNVPIAGLTPAVSIIGNQVPNQQARQRRSLKPSTGPSLALWRQAGSRSPASMLSD